MQVRYQPYLCIWQSCHTSLQVCAISKLSLYCCTWHVVPIVEYIHTLDDSWKILSTDDLSSDSSYHLGVPVHYHGVMSYSLCIVYDMQNKVMYANMHVKPLLLLDMHPQDLSSRCPYWIKAIRTIFYALLVLACSDSQYCNLLHQCKLLYHISYIIIWWRQVY